VGEMLAESDEQKGGGDGEEYGGECGLHGETPFSGAHACATIAITRMPQGHSRGKSRQFPLDGWERWGVQATLSLKKRGRLAGTGYPHPAC
jgi:hypothetical protein